MPRICDFGLARAFLEAESTGMTTTSEYTGTPRYIAPELVNSEVSVPPTRASDMYALGCLGLEVRRGDTSLLRVFTGDPNYTIVHIRSKTLLQSTKQPSRANHC